MTLTPTKFAIGFISILAACFDDFVPHAWKKNHKALLILFVVNGILVDYSEIKV